MPEDCVSQDCCPPDPYAYRSASAEDSQAGTNGGCTPVTVEIDPISGSYLFFPTYVVLSASDPDVVIRYTTDGTDPIETSTEYTAPFLVEQAGVFIKARAFPDDCEEGPVLAVLYQNPPFPIGFAWGCAELDKGGTWDVWAANGTVDNHFQLTFTLTGATVIKRLEIYQLDDSGEWTTGIVWSTDSPITIDGESFDAMPLLLFIAAAQQHTDYQASLGSFGAATHTWDLYGDKQFPTGGFFRLDMILSDDTRISSIIGGTNCNPTLPPVACPSPAAPTVTGKCDGAVDVTFANGNPQDYRVYKSQVGSPGGWVLASEGTASANPQTVEVTGLTPGGLYYFRVELEYAGCDFQTSIAVAGVPLPEPEVTIATDKTTVDPSESFTISWSSTNIGGATCGGCLDGQVSINQSLGCKSGNASGSQATSQATPGVYTYEITGCNACGTVTASVQVEVRDAATCAVRPSVIHIANPTTFLCGLVASCFNSSSASASSIAWTGELVETSACNWVGGTDTWGGCSEIAGTALPTITATVSLSGGVWLLQITSTGAGVSWQGTKAFGNSPLGVYTRTGGCASGPASITIT